MSCIDDCTIASANKFRVKALMELRYCLQGAAANAPSSNTSEDDGQLPFGNTKGTISVIESDNNEDITGQMTQNGVHKQPADTMFQHTSGGLVLKRCRGCPPKANNPPEAASWRGRG